MQSPSKHPNVVALIQAANNAQAAGVSDEHLQRAQAFIASSQRSQAHQQLQLHTGTTMLQLDIGAARAAMDAARQAGVATDQIQEAMAMVEAAIDAQARRYAATTAVEQLIKQPAMQTGAH